MTLEDENGQIFALDTRNREGRSLGDLLEIRGWGVKLDTTCNIMTTFLDCPRCMPWGGGSPDLQTACEHVPRMLDSHVEVVDSGQLREEEPVSAGVQLHLLHHLQRHDVVLRVSCIQHCPKQLAVQLLEIPAGET